MADLLDFGGFLRGRRERVSPSEVGLPDGGRRRTPGLRREELAMLAGISVDYLVRLEQGRETSPSSAVVAALAGALRLSDDERKYMWWLVSKVNHSELCPSADPDVGPGDVTIELLSRLAPAPAFVLGPLGEVMAWNDPYDRLMRPTGFLDAEPRNLLRFTFLDPVARSLYRDWEDIAREQVGNLRVLASGCRDDPPLQALVGELTTNAPDFVRFWADYDVSEKRVGVKRLAHPVAGDLSVTFTTLGLPEPGSLRLVAYMPADAASADALDTLITSEPATAPARHHHLRIVERTG